ncbi:PREDICTED: pericentrin-like isoform X1 [Cyprinodon variegatus]|uniref:pericentrin-like isoform X1 n=1 Tax=Cyprinodon variegatus TaxID=28743 RepID=UPI000742AC53|nr:PREDICTED: pericentrin-like isoform X1 [Cyprinodon variegatus]
MDEAERQKKLEAGRAKLASFRKKRAKSNGAGATKKTQKGKGQTVPKNDCSTQDRWVEAPPPSAGATALESRTSCEGGSHSEQSENQQCDQQEESFSSPDRSLSPVEDLREEELATLTGKEQLKLLQQAVEKRNEIIAKLSHNLQDALASRDQVQLEAQSLAGQIQALQKQLQQTSVEFLRIKGHSGAEAFGVAEHHHDLSSKTTNIRPTEGISEGSENAGHGSQQSPEGFSTETVVDTAIHNLMLELEEERKNNQRICAELESEMEKNQLVLSLLEEEKQGREEEQKELQNLQTQLSQAQNQCLVMQQYKEEKEKLNIEILELRKKLQEAEDSERRSDFKNESPAFCSQTLEEVNKRLEDEMKMLREEVDHVRQLLDKSERELKRREEEVEGLKASKNRENQTKAAFIAEANLEAGPDERDLDTSLQGDILMDRYLSSIPPAHSQSSVVGELLDQPSQLDLSADCSFELNSEVFGDQPLLSISNRICEQNDNIQNISGSQHSAPEVGHSSELLVSLWPHSSTAGDMEWSQLSEQQQLEEIDLEKQLLSQQCGELREELALKERDLGVLREEVRKSAEELEEARSRWALVTEELQEALGELEEERERRRLVEEEMNLKAHKQDNCDDKDVLMEEWGNETGQTSETPLIQFTANLSEYADESVGEINEEKQVEVSLLLPQSQEELQMETKPADSTKDLSDPTDTQIQTSLADGDHLISELEETTKEQKATLTLLSQETPKLNAVSEELEMTRTQFLELQAKANNLQQELLKSQDRLDSAEREKRELEGQIHTLRENLACLEEAQAQSVKQREEEKKKEQQMDEQIKKMEQVLEKELEQFENIIKSKEAELAEEKEKWEEERQEKEKLIDSKRLLVEKVKEKEEEVKVLLEKQILAVEEATARLKASHEQEVRNLIEKHQQEISELNDHLETELLKQRVSMEEEHKRQISFIKEVTEREHERMMSELTAKHNQELEQLRTEVSLELRESFEAAHQAEMQEVQAQKTLELEALRVSLTTVYTSQLEASQASEQQAEVISKLKASMKETFTQERAILQAQHESDLEKLKQENQEQQDRLQKQHQLEMDELKQQWETRFDQERASMEEKRDKEIEALKAQWEAEAETSSQRSLSEIQNRLNAAQTELINTQASLTETSRALVDARAALSETQSELHETKAALEEQQTSSKEQVQKLEEDLKQAWADKEAAAGSLQELVSRQETALQEKEQQVRHLEEKERQLQLEVSHLQEEKVLLKKSSEEEVGQLWTQLENMRASRQELGELKEQLMARTSQVDDIERLKTEFSEQKQEIKELHETELENLRKYFEKRLHASEETYKEEIALLQLRLVESALEESVMKTADDCFSGVHHDLAKDKDVKDGPTGHTEFLESLRLELEEKHAKDLSQLESSLALSYKDELQQERSNLTDQYYEELQEMKTRHALELEQLRAKLSESHVQDLTRVHLEADRQVEVEIEQRLWHLTEELQTRTAIIHNLENNLAALSEQHKSGLSENNLLKLREELQRKHENEISALRSDFEREKKCLEKALDEEREKRKSLEVALDDDDKSQQHLKTQYDNELQNAKDCMAVEINELRNQLLEQSEEKLRLAQQRFQEDKAALENHLAQRYEKSMAELNDKHKAELEHERTALLNKHLEEMNALNAKHKAQLDSLSACHTDQLAATLIELEKKHKAELVALESALQSKLEAAFQETSQAQLEALEAELVSRHQEERDELEKRMLGNMDTLEATYLKEVQALRDEINQLEEKHRQDLISKASEHKQLMECQAAEQLSIREELKRELAQVQMEKFKAMAAELTHVHKMELSAQKETLDKEHCKALETLKQQVLELEHQHSTALQEVSQTYNIEKDQLIQQHQNQLQELRGTSERELEACRRELEEEAARQKQHFLKELELLKVQSEERLQDRINHLKTEFEERKEAELEGLRRSLTSQQQEKEQSYTSKMSQLTTQLQQLDAVVTQLRAEIGCLQEELHGKRSEMETLDTLLQRRERESQEGSNLLKMLTDDLQDAKEERTKLYKSNEKMSKVLMEMLHSVIATEELIGQKINTRLQRNEQTIHKAVNRDQESGISVADLTSEDMELTQTLCESLLVTDSQISPGGEESALKACSRLRLAVETLLDLLNQAHTQLEQTCSVHFTLEEKFSQGREDATQLLEQHKLLLKQLDDEARLKSRLQLELHKAEGLLEGYVAEKAALEESLQQKEAQEERLAEELEGLKVKLHKMQGISAELDSVRLKYQELTEEHAILLRQKEHLSAGLGEREKALLAETERLTQDRLDLQRQAEKDHKSLSLRLRNLERELEDQETKGLEKDLQHKTHVEDLGQRVQALEKQLKYDRQFIEEQAVEREHERDEFQQEIRRLEAELRQTGNVDNKAHKFDDLLLQVESLQALIRDKTEDHASLLEANQQAQRDLAERNEEIDKLAGRIRELEQALLNSAESVRAVNEMEQELRKAKLREQELTQDKLALEQQQLSSRLQISALQSKLDEKRHCYHDNTHDPTDELRDALDAAQENLHRKEQEVEVLLNQLENVQRHLNQKEVELKHLTAQLEVLTNNNAAQVEELQKEISTLKETISSLTEVNENKEQTWSAVNEEEPLPAALLQEKNQEIDHLNCEIQKLEQELESERDSKVRVLEVELEDLRSQVEHLRSEITRVRQEKQEEEERLHEVISTLQAELATLAPNLHEVSDSQDGDSINPSPSPSPEPHTDNLQDRRGGPNSLKHEISLTHSTSSSSLHSRLKAVQSQFETAVAEKEGLERLLLTQEEEYRAQVEEFGKRLGAERGKLDDTQSLLRLRETEFEEEKEKRKLSEEERDSLKAAAEGVNAMREEKAHLNSVISDLQRSEQERMREIEAFKTKDHEMKLEMELLREASLTFEKQVQEVRAENLEMEKVVSEARERIKTLETMKGELSAEREALRRRECQLQEEIEKLRKEVGSMRDLIQELTAKLREKETGQEEAQTEVLTHADVTLAKADAALRQKESEFAELKSENEALKSELAAVKQGLNTISESAAEPHENGQLKVDLEAENQRMKAELERLQHDVIIQEEELTYQRRELEQLRQQGDSDPDHQDYQIKDISHRAFEEVLIVSRDEASLSSPEVLRRLECSEERIRERFHASVLDSHLSELSGLNCTNLEPSQVKTSPRVMMEPQHSRTITPDPTSRSSHSPGSLSVSDHFSGLDSMDPDKELEDLDLTAPPSPLGSTSSFSAQEWNSDGYGSNVSSELGARLRVELEQTERLDAQFVQYLRCRGINPTANTDSAAGSMSYSDDLLSPELQGLLKKVYQESCRILTLSQRRSAPSSQPNSLELKAFSSSQTQHHFEHGSTPLDRSDNPASSHPPMSWQQEKRALQETVVALRELLCRMAQRQTQTDYNDDSLHRGLLQSDGHVESQLRAELEEYQRQLKCARDALQEHKNKILSLRLVVEEAEEAMRAEQARFLELQQELDQERALILRKNKEEEQRREAVQVSSEKLKGEVMSLKAQVEQEKVACSNLRQELQIEQSRSSLLEKRLEEAQKELEDERERFIHKQELIQQEKTRVERLLNEAESRLAESRSKLEEERQHFFRQMDELNRRHESDSARDQKFISDLRSQLEQERRQAEDLATGTDKLRAEVMQSKRKWEEDDRIRLEELQREKEAVARHRAATETLKEQKRELSRTLEMEQQQCRRQEVELAELKERLQLLKEKERERDEHLEKQRRKEREELMEREMRQERTNNKLLELELLRRQDQQRMQELQRTLSDLEREKKEMVSQRLSGKTSSLLQHRAMSPQEDGVLAGASQQHQQTASPSSSSLLERVLKENSELTEQVMSLSQEKAVYKSRLTSLEKQLRRTECDLAKVATETENQPISDAGSNSRLQRYYERYLRAESFRKALVYQKRYLILLLGGFQDCEQATLALIARMGVRPSPPLIMQRGLLWRFRAVVRVVIAVSRMRFLTRKWQRAIRRVPVSASANGHAPARPKAEVLRQQQPRGNPDSAQNRDSGDTQRNSLSSLVPPGKSSFRLQRRPHPSTSLASAHSAGTSQDPERSLTEYIHHLEKVQQRLVGARPGSSSFQSHPK